MRQRALHEYWQFWLWLSGAGLPCGAFIVLDYLWYAYPGRYEIRDQLLAVSDWLLLAFSIAGLALMILACVYPAVSIRGRFALGVFSVVVLPISLFVGLIASFVVSGLPID